MSLSGRWRQVPFWGVHAGAVIGVIALGWSWSGLAFAVVLYYARMFFITAGFHRYFAHRTFRTSRFVQLVLALGAMTSAQQGPLWWASHHRLHHRFADQPSDPHSPVQRGFWWAHVAWIFAPENTGTKWERVADFARYPELRWLDRHDQVPPVALGALLLACGGAWALVWGMFVSTTLLWHGTFAINSLAHRPGWRRFATPDDSRNNAWLALLTMGEGWHNNHHHFPSAANQGLRRREVDATFWLLRAAARVGLISHLREIRPMPGRDAEYAWRT